LGECGYGWAYRVLDAQYVRTSGFSRAVPQRRRRVFVVGYLGDWSRAAAVLFDREGMQGHPPSRRKAGEIAPTIPSRSTGGGGLGTDFDCDGGLIAHDVAPTLNAGAMGRIDYESETMIAHAMRGEGFDVSGDGTGRGTLLVPVAFGAQNSAAQGDDVCQNHSPPLSCTRTPAVVTPWAVRRLTPRECERLQGFPDDWTRIPYRNKPADACPDGPRYKALGNSWAINCGQFVFDRIKAVEQIMEETT